MSIEPWISVLVASNRSYLIFWATMFMTSILGMLNLLSNFQEAHKKNRTYFLLFSIMYFGFDALSFTSLYSLLNIYKVSRNLSVDGLLGPEIQDLAINNSTLIDKFLCENGGKMIELRMNLSFLPVVFFLIIFLVSYYHERNGIQETVTSASTNIEEPEIINLILDDSNDYVTERASLIKLSSDKIKEHINYLFGILAAVFTLIQINDTLIFYYVVIGLYFGIYLIGRLFYWNVFNSFVLTHRPFNVESLSMVQKSNIYQSSAFWGIFTASKFHILGSQGYKKNDGIIHGIARYFTGWKKYLSLFPIIIIVLIIFCLSGF
jgi:hypothetical protein